MSKKANKLFIILFTAIIVSIVAFSVTTSFAKEETAQPKEKDYATMSPEEQKAYEVEQAAIAKSQMTAAAPESNDVQVALNGVKNIQVTDNNGGVAPAKKHLMFQAEIQENIGTDKVDTRTKKTEAVTDGVNKVFTSAAFPAYTFKPAAGSAEGVTYTVKITEFSKSVSAYTCDSTTSYNVYIKVTTSGDTVSAAVTYPAETALPTFTNTYTQPNPLTPEQTGNIKVSLYDYDVNINNNGFVTEFDKRGESGFNEYNEYNFVRNVFNFRGDCSDNTDPSGNKNCINYRNPWWDGDGYTKLRQYTDKKYSAGEGGKTNAYHVTPAPNLSDDGYPQYYLPPKNADGTFNSSLDDFDTPYNIGYLWGRSENAFGGTPQGIREIHDKIDGSFLTFDKDHGAYYFTSSPVNIPEYGQKTPAYSAKYNKATNKFDVYDIGTRNEVTAQYTQKEDGEVHEYGDFYPFNDWKPGLNDDYVHPSTGWSYQSPKYATDCWYGMKLETEFYMNKDSKVQGEDMAFSFSGDDDVLVYIDGVMVLDLAGTHGRTAGDILFAKGTYEQYLYWDGKTGSEAETTAERGTLADRFKAAGKYDSTQWKTLPDGSETFADYTQHTLKLFYLERGAAVSNCNLMFNLPVQPTGKVGFNKVWDDKGYAAHPEKVNYKVFAYTDKDPKEKKYIQDVELKETDTTTQKGAWSKIVDLPYKDGNANTYKYIIEEEPIVDGYKPTYSYADSEGGKLDFVDASGETTEKAQWATTTNTRTPADFELGVSKTTATAAGLTAPSETWSFKLEPVDGAPMPSGDTVTISTEGTQTKNTNFNNIKYYNAGTYQYKLTETTKEHWTCDKAEKDVYITVALNPESHAYEVTSVTDGSSPYTDSIVPFTNTYNVESTRAQVKALKKVTSTTGVIPDKVGFDFDATISPTNGVNPITVSQHVTTEGETADTQTQEIDFPEFTFTQPGEFTVTITEKIPANPPTYWKYETESKTVKITVVDNKGKLQATVDPSAAGSTVFTNVYDPGAAEVNLTTKKEVSTACDEIPIGAKFDFEGTITPTSGVSPTTLSASITTDSKEQKTYDVKFGNISFTRVGVYTVNLREKATSLPGWKIDEETQEQTLTITVKDEGGSLKAELDKDLSEILFKNSYNPAFVPVVCTVQKKASSTTGKIPAGITFNFTGKIAGPTGGADKTDLTAGVTTDGIQETYDLVFGTIKFSKVGIYTITLHEKNEGQPGWKFGEDQTITVTVTNDPDKGQLVAKTDPTEIKKITFENPYNPGDVTVPLKVSKAVESTTGKIPIEAKFDFTGKIVDGPEGGADRTSFSASVTTTDTTTKNYEVNFGDIKFTKVGTYKIELNETATSLKSWTSDSETKKIEIEVTDIGGKLQATTKPSPLSGVVFKNSYDPGSVDVNLQATKKVTSAKDVIPAGTTFEFEGTIDPTTGVTPQSVSGSVTTEEGKDTYTINFSKFTFTMVGKYTVTLKETSPYIKYWILDRSEPTVTITVEDVGGSLEATTDPVDPTTIVFTNTYQPPHKTYNDAHKQGQCVQIGEQIKYKIEATNYFDESSKIQISDHLTKGLKLDTTSFKLDGVAVPEDKIEVIGDDGQENGTTFKLETDTEIKARKSCRLEYSANTTKHAYTKHYVENDAFIVLKHGDEPKYNLEKLPNTVPEKQYGDESITKELGGVVHVGEFLQYKIAGKNLTGGPAAVTFTDNMTEGLEFVPESFFFNGNKVEPQPVSGGQNFTWTSPAVDDGAEFNLTYKAKVTDAALKENRVENNATINVGNTGESKLNPISNVVPEKKYADDRLVGSAVQPGDVINYQINVANPYPDGSNIEVIFRDVMTPGLRIDENSFKFNGNDPEGNLVIDGTSTKGMTFTYTTAESEKVAPHTTVYLTYSATVTDEAEEYMVENNAYVKVGGAQDTFVNKLPNTVPEKQYGDESITKELGGVVHVGDILQYKIVGKNLTGDSAAVTFTDTMTKGLDFVPDSFYFNGNKVEPQPVSGGQNFTWTSSAVDDGAEFNLTYKAKVTDAALKENRVENNATINVGNTGESKLNPLSNVVPEKKYADDRKVGSAVQPGDVINYQINVANPYPDGSNIEVIFRDVMTPGLRIDENSFKFNGNDPEGNLVIDGTSAKGMTFTYTTAESEKVAPHTTAYLTYSATVTDEAEEYMVENNAYVKVGGAQDTFVNKLPNTVPQKQYGDDSSTQELGGVVHVGDILQYKIVGKNLTGKAATVTFTDNMTEGLEFVADSFYFNGEKIEPQPASGGQNFTWTSPEVADNTEFNLTYKAKVTKAALKDNRVENSATINVGNTGDCKLNPLSNVVPEKKYSDDRLVGSAVQPGDVINYQINVANPFPDGESVEVIFRDTMTPGLQINENSFKLNGQDLKGNVVISGSSAEGMTFTYTTDETEKVLPHTQASLTYSATVTDEAQEYKVENDAYVKVGNAKDTFVNKLPNVVPEKEYADNHTDGQTVKVGDTISYKITSANFTGSPAYLTFSDSLSKGLAYNKDSFVLKVGDEETRVYPEFADNTFNFRVNDVPENTLVVLTYTCTVTEEAYEPLKVVNNASIGINSEPDFKLTPLENPVEPYVPESETSQTGDSTIYIMLGLLAIAGTAFMAYRRTRKNK